MIEALSSSLIITDFFGYSEQLNLIVAILLRGFSPRYEG